MRDAPLILQQLFKSFSPHRSIPSQTGSMPLQSTAPREETAAVLLVILEGVAGQCRFSLKQNCTGKIVLACLTTLC
jgi:hypothetical protein